MTTTPPAPPERKPYISPPPSKRDVEEVSNDQGMITDEWAPQPGATPDGEAAEKAVPDTPA
jgi:hypothetical protein